MTRLNKRFSVLKFFLLGIILVSFGFRLFENKPLIVENNKAALTYHLKGGELKDFHLKPNGLNPFSVLQGELGNAYLSINAAPDSNMEVWDLVNSPILKNKTMEFMMKADFLKDKITVKRQVKLESGKTGFHVKESFFNYDVAEKAIKPSQHISLNPELLANAIIYSNVELAIPKDIASKTPRAFDKIKDESSLHWIVIANADKNLLLGYVWTGNDYSKVIIESSANGAFLSLMEKDEEQKPLESKGQRAKSYFCFLQEINDGFTEVSTIHLVKGRIILETSDQKQRFDLGKTLEM